MDIKRDLPLVALGVLLGSLFPVTVLAVAVAGGCAGFMVFDAIQRRRGSAP